MAGGFEGVHRSSTSVFFAASPAPDIARALQLAELRAGQRFLDLGCGDGRVMAAAADIGAQAWGIEVDEALADLAEQHLVGHDARVIRADMLSADLATLRPDVVFAFLTFASLHALTDQLEALAAGTVVVTVGSPVPGWLPIREDRGVFAYRLPVLRDAPPQHAGWLYPGLAVRLTPGQPLVTSFRAAHPAGRVLVRPDAELARVASVRVGKSHLGRTDWLGVDLFWSAQPAGTWIEGALLSDELGVLPVACFYEAEPPFGSTPFDFESSSDS